MIELELLDAAQTRPLFSELIDIYQAAFSQPPYYETLPDFLNFAGRLSYHANQPGFRCVIARRAPGWPVAGFAYGYAGTTTSWFYQLATGRLAPEQIADFLSDFFEFAELAVQPDLQDQGLGGELHDALLAGLKNRTALLATPEVETRALYLYRKRGWQHLAGGIALPGTAMRYQIMAKWLAIESD